jgi:non-ribosomal peptide synthase protein (TIGR01720 family)
LYAALLEHANDRRFASLRTVIVAGEVCPADLVREHFQRLPDTALFNEYGPTEAAVWSTVHACERSDGSARVPIGRPAAHARLYVLDRYLQLVPVGVAGELYIGGLGLARGYLRRPELTAERFVPHPFGKRGERLYKTGDRVCWRPDGELEFLGRLDQQIRMRGDSSEVTKIEAASVRPEQASLRPAAKMQLVRPPYVAPRTPVEETLARIWGEVLDIDHVGLGDNFFELGGDSIRSMQVVFRARTAGLRCTALQIFQTQTLRELASVVSTAVATTAEQGEIVGPVLLSPSQHWFFAQDTPNPHHFNHSILLKLPDRPHPNVLQQAIRALAAHHDALRLRFQRSEAGWQSAQIPVTATEVPFDCVEFGGLPREEQQRLRNARIAEVERSLHLENGPLWRTAYFDFGPDQRPQLLLAAHQLVVDGISWRILLEDLHLAYEQLRRGASIQLLPKTTSFQEWSQRLHADAESAACLNEADYWRSTLATDFGGAPADHSSGPNGFASADVVVRREDELWTRTLLHDLPAASSLQINDLLLTALAETWRRVYGRSSLVLDIQGHGRTDLFAGVDLSRTVGWFACTYPLALEWKLDADLGGMLVAVKSQLRSVPREGLGWGQLCYLSSHRTPASFRSAGPRVVAFNYFGQFDGNLGVDSDLLIVETDHRVAQRCGEMIRPYVLEVNAFVQNGRFQSEWTYSRNLHHRPSVERLSAIYHQSLHEVVDYGLQPESRTYVPADFPLARIDADELHRILRQVEGDRRGS